MLQSNLSWSSQCKFVSAKASKLLNYLRHTLWDATADAKSRAYKCRVQPCLEYACTVWNPHTASNKFTLKTVQRRAARWAAGSRWSSATNQWSKLTDDCLNKLNWPTLTSHRNYLSVLMMYDIMNNRYDSFKLLTLHAHVLIPCLLQSTINSFRQYSFFVNAPFLWNTVATGL